MYLHLCCVNKIATFILIRVHLLFLPTTQIIDGILRQCRRVPRCKYSNNDEEVEEVLSYKNVSDYCCLKYDLQFIYIY